MAGLTEEFFSDLEEDNSELLEREEEEILQN